MNRQTHDDQMFFSLISYIVDVNNWSFPDFSSSEANRAAAALILHSEPEKCSEKIKTVWLKCRKHQLRKRKSKKCKHRKFEHQMCQKGTSKHLIKEQDVWVQKCKHGKGLNQMCKHETLQQEMNIFTLVFLKLYLCLSFISAGLVSLF